MGKIKSKSQFVNFLSLGVVIICIVIGLTTLYLTNLPLVDNERQIPKISQTVPPSNFAVRNGKIFDLQNHEFIVKGVTVVYGAFSGGTYNDRWANTNYDNAQRDFDIVRGLGMNLVRIFVKYDYAGDYPDGPRTAEMKQKIANVVSWSRARGLIVYLSNHGGNSSLEEDKQWLAYLAGAYQDDPYVWIGTMNEPRCFGPRGMCYDDASGWQTWQSLQNAYIDALRTGAGYPGGGYKGPIIINSIHWSQILSGTNGSIDTYPLTDPENNLIYGAHWYGDDSPLSFDDRQRTDINKKWADLAATSPFAMIVDETGAYNNNITISQNWLQGYFSFVTDWVNHRRGDGAIAFAWYWCDNNSMTSTSRNSGWQSGSGGVLTASWGEVYDNYYLKTVRTPNTTPVSTR